MQTAITIPIEERFNLGLNLIPAFLERRFPDMLRNGHIGRVQLAVADDLNLGNSGDFFANQLKDRAAEIAGDALIRLCPTEPVSEKGMVKPFTS